MNRLLFVAGEPGAGKSTSIAVPLANTQLGTVLHTDCISKRAAKHYCPRRHLGPKWQLWKLEFDQDNKQEKLEAAFFKSMDARCGSPLNEACNVIVEGVLSGHPMFRRTMQSILPEVGFRAEKVLAVALCLPWEEVQRNLKKRGRPEDQCMDFIKCRSIDYGLRLSEQNDVEQYASTDDCYRAAAEFLR